ncbi:hypothetical protein Ahy_B05g078574 [Arachis hypogaea]|uniref:Uncharacterized protein n=1 Tax=Arachis hypogaea TaxID=3818 RepID=A0A444Z7E2_ARAHY|nr:hypothetical protein Ahy_B05g078574 [Arachis hypogaea]
MLKFNNKMQPIGDETGLLSGVLGLLRADYEKFSICEKSWYKITTKEKVYIECVKKKLEDIEQQDESSRVLSQNDSIAQVLGKEKPGRVRGVGFGLTPSKLEAKKLKRKTMEDEVAAEKKKRQMMESALGYLFQQQGEELPSDITKAMSYVE